MVIRLFSFLLIMAASCTMQFCFSMEKIQSGAVLEKTQRVRLFFDAIHEHNLDAVRAWLIEGYKDKQIIERGLCYAVQEGNEAVINQILEANARAYAEGRVPSDFSDHNVPKVLSGYRRLFPASRGLHYALRLASAQGPQSIVARLLEACDQKEFLVDEPIKAAIEGGHLAIFQLLKGCLNESSRNELLKYAVRHGKLVELISLLEDAHVESHTRADILGDGFEPDKEKLLQIAVECGQTGVVRYLLSDGAGVHYMGRWALWTAVENGHAPIVKMLLEEGRQPATRQTVKQISRSRSDVDNMRAVMVAIECGYTEVIKLLVNWQLLENVETDYLLAAVKTGILPLVQALCKHITRSQEIKALRFASALRHWDIAEFFLKNAHDLVKAALHNDKIQVSELLRHSCDKFTFALALELAVCRGNRECLQSFLRYPIKRDLRNKLLRLASGMPSVDVVQLLVQFCDEQLRNAHGGDRVRDFLLLGSAHDEESVDSPISTDIESSGASDERPAIFEMDEAIAVSTSSERDGAKPTGMHQRSLSDSTDEAMRALTNFQRDGARSARRHHYVSDSDESMTSEEEDSDAEYDEKEDFLEPALSNAINLQRLAVLEVLLKEASINTKNGAFLHAACVGSEEVIRMILHDVADQKLKDEACKIAAAGNHVGVLKILFQAGITNDGLNEALLSAGEEGQIKAFKKLLVYPLNTEELDIKEAQEKRTKILETLQGSREEEWENEVGFMESSDVPDYPKAAEFLRFHFGGVVSRYLHRVAKNGILPRFLQVEDDVQDFIKNPSNFMRNNQLLGATQLGQTYLTLAVLLDQTKSFNKLLAAELPDYYINAADYRGYSASDYAGYLGRLDYLEPLIQKGYAKKSLKQQISALLGAARFAADNNHNRIAFSIVFNILRKINGGGMFKF
jgi:hypothetical protein